MNILCIGHACYDVTTVLDKFPIENTKNRSQFIYCGGGSNSNAAYLLGKWKSNVWFCSNIGNDEYGKKIEEEFNNIGVNIDYLYKNKKRTSQSFIIINKENGSRTTFTNNEEKENLDIIDFNFTPDIILIDGSEPKLSKYILEKYKDTISIIDAGAYNEDVISLSNMVDYVVCSKDFAEKCTDMNFDINNKDVFYKKLENKFKNNIVVTLEENGCLYKYNDEIKIMPTLKVNPVDTTGAGDIFHGAFTYALSKGHNFEFCLKIANIAGSLSVTKLGSRFSVPSILEMKEIINDFE